MQVATPVNEMTEALNQLGWSLKSVKFSGGQYVAKAVNSSTGQDIEREGSSPEMAIAAVYQYAQRASTIRTFASRKVASWDHSHWAPMSQEIGEAYSKMQPYDEQAAEAWQALAAESKIQADAIRKQIRVEVVDDPEPYRNMQEMCEDVHKNRHFAVSRANSEHPMWSVEDNVNFRIVHDILGHCQSGGDFGWMGELKACGAHFPLISPLAREALFTECIGQTAYNRTYHGFGPQKVGLMSEFLHPVQQKEGEHVWVPHGGLPALTQSTEEMMPAANYMTPGQWVNPNQFPSPAFSMPNAVMQGYDVPAGGQVKFRPKQQSVEAQNKRDGAADQPRGPETPPHWHSHDWIVADDDWTT